MTGISKSNNTTLYVGWLIHPLYLSILAKASLALYALSILISLVYSYFSIATILKGMSSTTKIWTQSQILEDSIRLYCNLNAGTFLSIISSSKLPQHEPLLSYSS